MPYRGGEKVWVWWGKVLPCYLLALLSFDRLASTEVWHLQRQQYYEALLAGEDGGQHWHGAGAVEVEDDIGRGAEPEA